MNKPVLIGFALLLLAVALPGCKTLGEMREKEKTEITTLKRSMKTAEASRADNELVQEELKLELARVSQRIESNYQQQEIQREKLKDEIDTLKRQVADLTELAMKNQSAGASRTNSNVASYAVGKRLFDKKQYADAADILRDVIEQSPKSSDGKKGQFLLAEALYANKDFGQSILEFNNFKKKFPKDGLVPRATFRQALCFKNLGKKKESELFFQEIIEKFPKHSLAAKAKREITRLK